MIQTADQEREWWEAAGPENIWGVGAWEEGIAKCIAEIDPILTGLHYGTFVLDLGCGPGRLLQPLAQAHPRTSFTGLDIRFYDHSGINERNLGWMVGDGRKLLFAPETLNAVYSVALFQHLPHEATSSYISQASRCLKPGGQVRFQHVIGTEDSFLSHQIEDPGLLADWCMQAGLEVTAVDVGRIHEQWVWLTARKP